MSKNDTLMRLDIIIKQKNWTYYKLAKESGIPQSSMTNFIQRNTEPTLPTLRKICAGLGISLSEFFSDEHTPEITEYSADERRLISLYRELKLSDRKLLMTYAQALNRELPD